MHFFSTLIHPIGPSRESHLLCGFECGAFYTRDGSTGWQGRLEELEINRQMKEVRAFVHAGAPPAETLRVLSSFECTLSLRFAHVPVLFPAC